MGSQGLSFYFAASQILRFLQLEGLWPPGIEEVYGCHFSTTAFAHFVSLSVTFWLIPTIFQTFPLLYLLQWSVISDYNSLKA